LGAAKPNEAVLNSGKLDSVSRTQKRRKKAVLAPKRGKEETAVSKGNG
jgi:hypothetical protein